MLASLFEPAILNFPSGSLSFSRWSHRPAVSVPIRAVDGRSSGLLGKLNDGGGSGKVVIDETASKKNGRPCRDDLREFSVQKQHVLSTIGNSTNIMWQECPVGSAERQKLLGQKGCVVWITGLSGSGKSTLACALSRELHSGGFLTYVLDGDNVRHGLNRDLGFKAEDREENIRRIGEVAKLFADAGIICIASLISPYKRDRDACRALLQPKGNFIEVFMDMPLEVCEARDPKGLYKLARAGMIKGFTGIDDPYEPPLNSEIVIQRKNGVCSSPATMSEEVMAYLKKRGYLQA